MRTLILLDGGRLAYATSEALTELEINAMKGHEHAAGAPTVYAFQADELIDARDADLGPDPLLEAANELIDYWRAGIRRDGDGYHRDRLDELLGKLAAWVDAPEARAREQER